MAKYIERKAVVEMLENAQIISDGYYGYCGYCTEDVNIDAIPAADVVEVETVAQMLYHALGDECPCNYGSSDGWLPEVCELQDECPNPKDKLGCWKQYIKHFEERRESE